MHFRDTLSALLPPPRDDEPASLRQDILDELGDHLACAYNRELLRGADSSVARQRVLEQFGDPAAVARRLWLNAMRGKIMAQRVLTATCLALLLACLGLVGLVWMQSSRAAGQAAEAERKLAEALADAQATNKNMLNKLSEMSEAIRNPRSTDWNPLSFHLVEETEDGQPVLQALVNLSREGQNPNLRISRLTDATGLADFGLVEPGNYLFRISLSSNVYLQDCSARLKVEPGSEVRRTIVCPRLNPQKVPVKARFRWPDDLAMKGLALYAPFIFRYRELGPDLKWRLQVLNRNGQGTNEGGYRPEVRSVLLGPEDSVTEIVDPNGLIVWTPNRGNGTDFADAIKTERGLWADILDEDLRGITRPGEETKWEPGTYGLYKLLVLRPDRSQEVPDGRKRFEVVAATMASGVEQSVSFNALFPSDGELQRGHPFVLPDTTPRNGIGSLLGVELPPAYWKQVGFGFEARQGQANEWSIPIPDELINAVREALKVNRTAKAKTVGPAAPVDGK